MPASPSKRGIGLIGLIALVVSSSIGSGVFALSSDIAGAAAPGPALVAWAITGAGFMCLATTFGKLSLARPDLDGIVAYAKEGFGPFAGFVSGWGYWLSIWIGNVAFGVMLDTVLGYFVPTLSGGLTAAGVTIISALNWAIVLLVMHGVEEASALNAVVMVCKLVPILSFIAVMAALFSPALFTADFWGTLAGNIGTEAPGATAASQVVNCLMVMMWVFVGMEGATVLGGRARRREDVSRATVLGTTVLLAVYIAASVLPYGYLPREELALMEAPSMAYIFRAAVGPWGGTFISGGLVVSIFGAWLSYTILASEALRSMADMELLPRRFGRLNAHGAPSLCLLVTGAMIQALTLVMLLSEEAYRFAYSLCTASIVISWALASAAMARYAWPRRHEGQLPSLVLASVSTAFLVAAVALAGLHLLALCCIAYVPGIGFYLVARRELGHARMLTGAERALAAVIVAAAALAVHLLATGAITP